MCGTRRLRALCSCAFLPRVVRIPRCDTGIHPGAPCVCQGMSPIAASLSRRADGVRRRIARMLSADELRELVATGDVDTVVVAFTDMQGRLMGKRLHGEFFVEETEAEHPVEGCNYLLAL